jgi:hypothetical protein
MCTAFCLPASFANPAEDGEDSGEAACDLCIQDTAQTKPGQKPVLTGIAASSLQTIRLSIICWPLQYIQCRVRWTKKGEVGAIFYYAKGGIFFRLIRLTNPSKDTAQPSRDRNRFWPAKQPAACNSTTNNNVYNIMVNPNIA